MLIKQITVVKYTNKKKLIRFGKLPFWQSPKVISHSLLFYNFFFKFKLKLYENVFLNSFCKCFLAANSFLLSVKFISHSCGMLLIFFVGV